VVHIKLEYTVMHRDKGGKRCTRGGYLGPREEGYARGGITRKGGMHKRLGGGGINNRSFLEIFTFIFA